MMRDCSEHGTNSNVCDLYGCFGAPPMPPRVLEIVVKELVDKVAALETALANHNHNYVRRL